MRPYETAFTIVAKLSSVRIITAASFDTSVPVIPIATPMSAVLSAGASFTPSPVIATTLPLRLSSCTSRILSSGATRATTPMFGEVGQELVVGHRCELRAGERPALDAELLGDRGGGGGVVAGDHPDLDAGRVALGDRGLRLGAGRVDDADHGEQRQVGAPAGADRRPGRTVPGRSRAGRPPSPAHRSWPSGRWRRARGDGCRRSPATRLAVGRPEGPAAVDQDVGGALDVAAHDRSARRRRSSRGTSP